MRKHVAAAMAALGWLLVACAPLQQAPLVSSSKRRSAWTYPPRRRSSQDWR